MSYFGNENETEIETKFRLPFKLSLLRAQTLPGPAPDICLTLLQISFKSVHFRLSYSRTREDRSFAPQRRHICPQNSN